MNILEFIEFFKAQLIDDTIELSIDAVIKDIPDWDSLTAMLLITNLKDEHSISISIAELQNCKIIGDLYILINNK